MYIIMGNFYLQQSKPDEAEMAYQKAVAMNPANVRYQMILAGFFNASGENEKAAQFCAVRQN